VFSKLSQCPDLRFAIGRVHAWGTIPVKTGTFCWHPNVARLFLDRNSMFLFGPGMWAPKGTPEAVVSKLNSAVGRRLGKTGWSASANGCGPRSSLQECALSPRATPSGAARHVARPLFDAGPGRGFGCHAASAQDYLMQRRAGNLQGFIRFPAPQ
jgi:hypothetical protein